MTMKRNTGEKVKRQKGKKKNKTNDQRKVLVYSRRRFDLSTPVPFYDPIDRRRRLEKLLRMIRLNCVHCNNIANIDVMF